MEIQQILRKYDFRFKKSLGQNFIADKGLLSAIVRDAGIENTDLVLEIGAGAGTLTRELSEKKPPRFTPSRWTNPLPPFLPKT